MSLTTSSSSGACSAQTSSESAESWVVLDANGSETPGGCIIYAETEYTSNDVDLTVEWGDHDGGQTVMTSLRNFGNWIKRGLEASRKYNLPSYRSNLRCPPPPQRQSHQQITAQHQTQQRQSHQQTHTQHQTQQRQSHQQTTLHQSQQRQSHQQTTRQHQTQQRQSHQQTTQQRQSHQQTTQHQTQQRQSHQQTTQHQTQQRQSQQQTTQRQTQQQQSHQQTQQRQSHQQTTQQRQSHQQTTQQRQSHQQTTQHQTQQRQSQQQTTQRQTQQQQSHQQTQQRQSHQQTTQQRQSHQQTTQQRQSHQQTTQHQTQQRQSQQQTTQRQTQQQQSHQQTQQRQSHQQTTQQRQSHQQTTPHQTRQRQSHQQTTQCQTQQRLSHQQTTQRQTQQRQSHQQTQQRQSHQQTTQQRQSHQQTTPHQTQQRQSHQQTTQHQTQQRQSHQQTTQHQTQQRQSHQQTTQCQTQQRLSHQQTTQRQTQQRQSHQQTQQRQSHQQTTQQRQSHQQTTPHQTQQRQSHQQTTQRQTQQRQSHQQTTQRQTQQRQSHQQTTPHQTQQRQSHQQTTQRQTQQTCESNGDCELQSSNGDVEMIELADERLQLHPMYFPLLTANPDIVESLEDVEERNLVEINILRSSGDAAGESIYDLALKWHTHEDCIRVSELDDYLYSCESIASEVQQQEWLMQDLDTDDEGKLSELPQELNQYLNDCYFNRKLTKTQFMYDKAPFIVDFQTNTITNVSSGDVQYLHKRPQPVSWLYSLGQDVEYMAHQPSDSEAIEHIYQYGGYFVELAGTAHTFDFNPTSMCQIDLTTGEKVSLRRNPMPKADTQHQHNITLRIKGLPENVSKAKNEVEYILQSATETIKDDQLLKMFSPQHHEMVLAHFTNVARQYCILLTSMKQTQNGLVCIQLQGNPRYVHPIHKHLLLQCLVLQKCIAATNFQFYPQASQTLSLPPSQTASNFNAELVTPQSPEWNMVLGIMQQTMPAVCIESLQRVHHRYQWDRYQLEMRHIAGSSNEVNEWYLFHGTRGRDPLDVVRSDRGFDFRCSREDCLWGSGVYFAVNASYSDRYHHPVDNSDLKQIILARVLTGQSFSYGQKSDNTLRRPPKLPSGSGLYDTVNGYTHGSFVYVVYDHGKSYPAYIITYK